MKLKLTNWDNDLPPEADEEYKALVRTLKFIEGFGLIFVRCSPAEGERLIGEIKKDITDKNIEVLKLNKNTDNVYDLVRELEEKTVINERNNTKKINILFIQGIEQSFYGYEEVKKIASWQSKEIYNYSWKGVPAILVNLNQQRERFRDNFNICFVFILPLFAIKYFIQRAPDFFDWRSGVFEFPTNTNLLEKESLRIIQESDFEQYLTLTIEERNKKIIEVQNLLAEDNQIQNRKADLFYELGKLHSAAQDYQAAVASFDQAVKFKTDYHQAWNYRGIALRNLKRYEEAVASFEQAVKFNHQAWNNQGIALGNLGRYEEAIASYDEALKFKPDKDEAWYGRGFALGNLGRFEEAIASYDEALKFKPDDHIAWSNRGVMLGELGRLSDAIASYDEAIKFKPDYTDAWNNRGIALGDLGRYEDAIASFDEAIKFKPDDADAWNNRGSALGNLGRFSEAIASYDEAIKFKPDDHVAWYNRACAYGVLGNIDAAIENLQTAINLYAECREMAKTDADFDNIRNDPRFQTLINL